MSFLTADYGYQLPDDAIARYPCPDRGDSRLMRIPRSGATASAHAFSEIAEWLRPGDGLVINTTKVFFARLLGRRRSGGKVEIFLLEERERNLWRGLVRSARFLKNGIEIVFDENAFFARQEDILEDGTRLFSFHETQDIRRELPRAGHVPIPPYLRRPDEAIDRERYQTVFAEEEGSVAAPTAGLHFTKPLLDTLQSRGVILIPLTLHIGRGTFAPIQVEDLREHPMESEYYHIPGESLNSLKRIQGGKGRLVAVGTTSTRSLESWARTGKSEGWTDLFIHPPFEFQAVDILISNFHLPQSTLLMLVSAFAGRENTLHAYREALDKGFKFYSYGDACFFE